MNAGAMESDIKAKPLLTFQGILCKISCIKLVNLWALSTCPAKNPVQENGVVIWITGLLAWGKTSLGHHLLQGFTMRGVPPLLLDGDLLRSERDEIPTYSEVDQSKASRTASERALAVALRGALG
jgi:adenylylsulfate kinase-like enzyme